MNIHCNRTNMKSKSERRNGNTSDDDFMPNTKKKRNDTNKNIK